MLAAVGPGNCDPARRLEPRVQRDAVLQRRGQGERLHRRPRLAARAAPEGDQVDLALLEVPAGHHGPDHPVAVDGDDRRQRVVLPVEGLGDGVVGGPLGLVVERRVHPQPAAVDLAVGEAVVEELRPDGLDEVLGARTRRPGRAQALALLAGRIVWSSTQAGRRPASRSSAVILPSWTMAHEDGATPAGGLLGIPGGVGRLGGPDQAGQVGGVGQVELTDVLAEVGLGRSAHAVGAPAEVDGVEVALEDLLLGAPARA